MEIRGNRFIPKIAPAPPPTKMPEAKWEDPEVIHDRPDANKSWGNEAETRKTVETNLPKEAAALEKLSSEQRELYAKISAALPSSDPDARLSLQNMLLDGRLPGSKDMEGSKDLLGNLAALSEQPMQTELSKNRGELVGDLIQELDDPTCLAQKNKATCGATTVQIMLAGKNPAEYVRLMSGLASPEGKATLADGKTIRREAGTEKDDGSGRTIGTRLMAPAFMEYANGALEYDNSNDQSDYKVTKMNGLLDFQIGNLAESVLKQNFKNIIVGPTNSPSSTLAAISKAASPQNPAIASLTYGGTDLMTNGHYIQVTGVKDGQVTYINPWGQVESMGEEQFKKHLLTAFIPNKSASVLDKAENIVNTADMLTKVAGQQIEKTGILDKIKNFFKW